MNLLSITAAYGVLVAVSQWGWLHQLFGFPEKVPAVMELLGKANWWLPRPLARILPAVTVEDAPPAPASEPAMTRH